MCANVIALDQEHIDALKFFTLPAHGKMKLLHFVDYVGECMKPGYPGFFCAVAKTKKIMSQISVRHKYIRGRISLLTKYFWSFTAKQH